MVKIQFFSPPNGEIIDDPKPAFLRQLVLHEGEDYWNAGAGEGDLTFLDDGKKSLMLVMDKSLGFYLEYVDVDHTYYVSLGGDDFKETVTAYVCGNPLVLPRAFFVPRQIAWAAVQEFCKSGERSPQLRWAKRSELNWDYGYSET